MGPFVLTNYDKELNKTFSGSNNGHALEMAFPAGVYHVSGGGLTGVYTTVQFHFHWGSNNEKGSEHTMNGKKYAGEVSKTKGVTLSRRLRGVYFVACHALYSTLVRDAVFLFRWSRCLIFWACHTLFSFHLPPGFFQAIVVLNYHTMLFNLFVTQYFLFGWSRNILSLACKTCNGRQIYLKERKLKEKNSRATQVTLYMAITFFFYSCTLSATTANMPAFWNHWTTLMVWPFLVS